MSEGRQNRGIEFALLGLLSLLWGSSYLFAKSALADVPPLTLIAARVSIAAVVLVAVATALPRDGRSWRMLFVQAIFNSIAAWTILAWGQQFIDSGLATVLNSTAPLFVLVLALVLGQSRLQPTHLVGACVGLFGVVLIVGTEALNGLGQHVWAQLAAIFGAILYACAALYGRRLSHLPPVVSAAGTMIWASLVLVPASLLLDEPWTLSPSPLALSAIAALALPCTAGALLLYFRLLRTLGSLGVASQAYLRSGVEVTLGVVVLGEVVTPTMGLGLALAIAGVVLANWSARKPQ